VPRFGPWLIAIAAIVVGMATAVAMRRYAAFSPWFNQLGATLLAAIALPVLALVLGRRKRVGAPHVDREQAVEITRNGLLVRSEPWAEKVAKLNGKAATHTMEPSLALVERILPLIGALLPLAFGMWWYDQWHTTMWIDNGTHQHVVVRGNGHELASLDAGERIEVTIPRDTIHLTSTANDDVTIEEHTNGTWVLNVGGAHCYEYQSFAYGENEFTLFFATEPRRYQETLFDVAANWFFQPPPKTITISKHPSLPSFGAVPHYRGALQIVPCH
jgi:hypothetical protein